MTEKLFSIEETHKRGEFSSPLVVDLLKEKKFDMVRNNSALFWGIRHNCINIYFMGASIAKIEVTRNKLKFTVASKYLGHPGKNYYHTIPSDDEWVKKIDRLMNEVKEYQIEHKNHEKIAQQQIILANNRSDSSPWYCFDMEYVLPNANREEPKCGRFDILAVSRKPMKNGKHQILLIELKYGDNSYAGAMRNPPDPTKGIFEQNFGSGIIGHAIDYLHYTNIKSAATRLESEMHKIFDVKRRLQLPNVPRILDNAPVDTDFIIAVITLGCKDIGKSQARMRRYLFEDEPKKSGRTAQSILLQYGHDIEKTEHGFKLTHKNSGNILDVSTLFSTETIETMGDKAGIFDSGRYKRGL